MKKIFLLSLAATLICSLSFATIRRVGFLGPAVIGVDYGNFQLAHDAAITGDTIMMQPGSSVAGNVSKTLVIIGPGFLLNPSDPSFSGNADLQANTNSNPYTNPLQFKTGSSNTQVLGCTLYYVSFDNSGLSGITIKRCFFPNINAGTTTNVQFSANASNITFQQCIFNNLVTSSSGITVTNLSFISCLFNGLTPFSLSAANTSGIIINSIFSGSSSGSFFGSGAWSIQNCISQNPFTGTNIVFNNNVGTGTQFPAGNGNQQNKPWNTIFTLTGSFDGKYALKAGSPAIGAGINGVTATDCGIFGGATPYRLSGIPSVPTIYALTSPQGTLPAGNTVQINVSTRSNN